MRSRNATNQSGLGATIEVILTYGCVLVISNSKSITSGDCAIPPPLIKNSAPPSSITSSISSFSSFLEPDCAIITIPSVAIIPVSNKCVSALCVIPTKPDQCAFDGKSVGWVNSLQTDSNVTL